MAPLQPEQTPLAPDMKKVRAVIKSSVVDQQWLFSMGTPRYWWVSLRRQFMRYYFVHPPRWKILLRAKRTMKRMLPDFFSIGAVRSGTTLLADYLMQHPCVVLPLAKEIGVSTLATRDMLMAQFPTLAEKRKVERRYGKAVTGFAAPVMPGLVFPFLASAQVAKPKLIIIMRNPIDRAYAQWRFDQMFFSRIKDDPLWRNFPDFDEIAAIEVRAAESAATSAFTSLSGVGCGGYIQHSIYIPFLETLFRFFEKNDAMFIDAADFFEDPVSIVKQAYAHLELPPYEPVKLTVTNAAPKDNEMKDATREMLRTFYEPLNEKLYTLIGRDFGWR